MAAQPGGRGLRPESEPARGTSPRATPARKGFRAGTHRLCAPGETLGRLENLRPALGITRVANVTGLDTIGIPVVMVCRPNSRSLAVSQGKGVDLAAAKASGLMETFELYCAERIALPLELATWREARSRHPVIDVAALPRVESSLFHPDLSLLWLEGHELMRGEPAWLPYEVVHMNYTLPLPSGSGCFAMSSNGLASGNHLLEAISHGLCEVIERDAATLWHLGGREAEHRTRLDLESVDEALCRQVLDRFAEAGVEVAVWDMTSDVEVPAFYCLIFDREPQPWRPPFPNFGMGCHPTPRVALLRALTEAAQSRLTMIASSRDDVGREDYELLATPDPLARLAAEIDAQPCARDFRSPTGCDAETFDEEVAWLLERLAAAGLGQAVIVDLTPPGIPLKATRVVVPGLEPLYETPGFVPGRRARAILAG